MLSGKGALAAALGVIGLVLTAIIAFTAPPGASQDSAFPIACVGVLAALVALGQPLLRAAASPESSATGWFRATPALAGGFWLLVGVVLVFVAIGNVHASDPDHLSWRGIALAHGLLAAVWLLATLAGTAAADRIGKEEKVMTEANGLYDRAKLAARDLGTGAKKHEQPLQIRVQKLVNAVSFAPRNRFARDTAGDLVDDLESLAAAIGSRSPEDLDVMLTTAERKIRELGIGA